MSQEKIKKLKLKILHGPNLNLLGTRQTAIYGNTTLRQINAHLKKIARDYNVEITCFQSNCEGFLVDQIQRSLRYQGFVINAAAYTHTSIAIRDALLAVNKPFVEVHLSNIKKREKFRKHSYLSDIAIKVIMGHGEKSYYQGLEALISYLKNHA